MSGLAVMQIWISWPRILRYGLVFITLASSSVLGSISLVSIVYMLMGPLLWHGNFELISYLSFAMEEDDGVDRIMSSTHTIMNAASLFL